MDSIKQMASDLLLTGISRKVQEPLFLRAKAATIVTEIAKRIWPGKWPELDQFLRQLRLESRLGCELVLVILKDLMDSVFVLEDEAALARKKELGSALTWIVLDVPVLLESLDKGGIDVNPTAFDNRQLVFLVRQQSETQGWLSIVLELFLASVRDPLFELLGDTLSSIVCWIPLKGIPFNMCERLFGLLSNVSEREQLVIFDILTTLCNRSTLDHPETRNQCIWRPLSEMQGFLLIETIFNRIADPTLGDRISQMVHELVRHQVCHKKIPAPDGLDQLLRLVMTIEKSQMILPALGAAETLTLMLKHKPAALVVKQYLEPLAIQISSRHDMQTDSDYWNIWLSKRQEIIRLLTQMDPQAMSLILTNHIRSGFASKSRTSVMAFEVLLSTVSKMPDQITQLHCIPELYGLLLQYNDNDVNVLEMISICLSAFSQIVSFFPSLLFPCLSQLMRLSVLDFGDSDRIIVIRRRSANALGAFGIAMHETLLPHLQELSQVVYELISQNKTGPAERANMVEFVIVIVLASSLSMEQKQSYLSQMTLQDMNLLQQYLKMDLQTFQQQFLTQSNETVPKQKGLLSLLHNIYFYLKRSVDLEQGKQAWAIVQEPLIQATRNLIHMLHSVVQLKNENWLSGSLVLCYQITSALSRVPGHFAIINQTSGYYESLFLNLERLPFPLLKCFMDNVALQYILKSPLDNTMLQPFFVNFCSILNKMIPKMDQLLVDEEQGDDQEEIERDKEIRSLIRGFGSFWSTILHKDQEAFQHLELAQGLLTEGKQFMESMTILMLTNDTKSCAKALALFQSVMEHLMQEHLMQLLGLVLMVPLRILGNGYQKMNHNTAIVLFADLYYTMRKRSDIPLNQLKQHLSQDRLMEIDQQLLNDSPKERHQRAKHFLLEICGVERSEQFKDRKAVVSDMHEKHLFMLKSEKSHSILDEQEDSFVSQLFE
ncbi:hypothetical protein EDD86DRAFT_239276 [Gorgonomyces haynaldii]|nr:hypothetical protein EDD86DRAFT_239276 [Gorgonomyces haynaldii]